MSQEPVEDKRRGVAIRAIQTFILELRDIGESETGSRPCPGKLVFLPEILAGVGGMDGQQLKVVPLDRTIDAPPAYALYRLAQGRRPGRKDDFSGFFRVGGLMVEQTEPPACGLVEWRPSDDALALPSWVANLGERGAGDLPFLRPDAPDTLQQYLITDGYRWRAWVRTDDKTWTCRETYPAAGARNHFTSGEEQAIHAFLEFLRRAMLPWPERRQSEILARYLGSYVRSYALRLQDDDQANRRQHVANHLRHELGLQGRALENAGDTPGAPEELARIMALVALLKETARRAAGKTLWTALTSDRKNAEQHIPFRHPFRQAGPLFLLLDEWPNEDQRWCDLLRAVTTAVFERSGKPDALNRLAADDFDGISRILSHWMPLASMRSTVHPLHGLMINPGIGDLPVPWLDADRIELEEYIVLEPNPIAFGWLRLRIIQALKRRVAALRRQPRIVLRLENPLIRSEDDWNHGSAPSRDALWLMAGDFRGKGQALGGLRPQPVPYAADHLEVFRNEWSLRRDNLLAGTATYLRWAEVFLSHRTRAVACLFLDETVLDGIDYAPGRKGLARLASLVGVLHHNTLPASIGLLLVRYPPHHAGVLHDFPCGNMDWVERHAKKIAEEMLTGRENRRDRATTRIRPSSENRYAWSGGQSGYSDWPSLRELVRCDPYSGPSERRGGALLDFDPEALRQRMRDYFDSSLSDDEIAHRHPGLMTDASRFDARATRGKLLRQKRFDATRIVEYPFRPFDRRYAYLDDIRPLFKEPSPELLELSRLPGQSFLKRGGTARGRRCGPSRYIRRSRPSGRCSTMPGGWG